MNEGQCHASCSHFTGIVVPSYITDTLLIGAPFKKMSVTGKSTLSLLLTVSFSFTVLPSYSSHLFTHIQPVELVPFNLRTDSYHCFLHVWTVSQCVTVLIYLFPVLRSNMPSIINLIYVPISYSCGYCQTGNTDGFYLFHMHQMVVNWYHGVLGICWPKYNCH